MPSDVNQDRTGGRRIWIIVLMALFTLSANAGAAQVLVLNSYHDGFEWTDDIVRGVGDVLRSTKQKISIHTEYMDTRRHPGREFLDTLAAFYKAKFANVRFNAIIASDDTAVSFLLEHHDELFPGVPVIFCGVNEYRGSSDYLKQYPEARKWLTGVLETIDVEDTVSLALKLHPGTKTLVTVGEEGELDYASDSKHPRPNLNVRSIDTHTLTFQQLGDELAALPRDAIVLLSAFSHDATKHQLSIAESSRFVCERSAVPVYGVNKNTLGYGIVGGKLTEGYFQGVEAARLAILVMDETPPSNIPIRTESSNRYMFDQRELRRWGISESLLPKDSIIIERSTTFYERHTTAVWATAAFIVAQGLVISLLVAGMLKRRRIQQALAESEGRFRTIFEQSRDAIGVSAGDNFAYVNPAWAQMFGYGDPSELIGVSIYDLITPETREDVRRRRRDRPLATPVHDCYLARGLRKDQTTTDTEVRASYFTAHGKTYTLAILRDVTAEKRSSEALFESQRQLDIALQAGRMGTWRWDAATNLSTWSTTQEALFGLSPGSYSGELQDFLGRIHRDDREAVADAVADAIRTGNDYRVEYRIVWPDESRHWVVAHGKVFLDSDGNPKGITGLTWDVTERRLAEDKIRYQLQLTQAITTHAAESLIMTDENDRITFLNPAAERTFGWTNEELLGRSFHGTLAGGSEYSTPDCPLIAASRYGEPLRDHEDIFFRKDGDPVDIVCSQTPIMHNQNVTGVVMVIHDVTAKKQAERELRRQEEQFRRVFEESPVGMALVSPEQKFQMVNPALAQMMGYSQQELLEFTFLCLTHPDDRPAVQDTADELLRGDRTPLQVEKRYVNKNGDTMWVNLNASSFRDANGGIASNLLIIENITERKHAEQELARQAHELALSNADLQQFAYVTSHDLQEPLRNIASFSQMLTRRYMGRLDADADEFIGHIISSVDRMRALIQDLLGYSRIVNSDRAPSGPVEMNQVVELALNNLRQSIDASGSIIHTEELPTLTGDPVLLVQIFQNLIGNAIKYRGTKPPEIWISSTRVEPGWIVSVRDNGIGIDPRYHERIFGVFKRLHGRDVPGTGIGLAICRKIVEKHGGKIWVESEPGAGSTFRFTLNA